LSRSRPPTSPSTKLGLVVAAALAAAALLSGCGATTTDAESANTGKGKELFAQECGSCHTLADAGTAGTVGPNLDDAFKYAREDGFDQSTFFEVVLEQMRIPGPPMPDYDEPGTETYLPEDDLRAIAAYVAEASGKPPPEPPDSPEGIFAASCGSCHVLEAAGTEGTTGPNLDESQPELQAAIEQITNGGGGMPAFRDQLNEEQIRALAQYIVESTSRRR
jgi:mono/diheme cytochrome c family protein